MPWDQSRVAHLEARLNAPLPVGEVAYVVKRMEPWRPGAQGRFAAVYVRQRDVGEGLAVEPELNGKPVPVQFMPAAHRQAMARRLGLVAAGSAVGGFLLITLGASIWTARVEAADRLASLEQLVSSRSREAATRSQAAAEVRALDDLGLRGRQASAVLDDLAWASKSRNPAASVEAFHWEGGLLAVEVRGDTEPFLASSRTVRRAGAQLRRGVWLWGVEPAAVPGAGSAP